MSKAKKIFLSIRQAKISANNGFTIKAGKRRLDKDENLYYKVMDGSDSEKKVKGLHRMVNNSSDGFVGAVKTALKNQVSKDVLFFIHGYHPFKTMLHTYLLDKLVENYSNSNTQQGFGAIIFFSWPNRGLQWREDDEAVVIGRILAQKYAGIFSGIEEVCNKQNGKLHLMCQSFGHHILNSFVRHFKPVTPCFENVFLLAADIPNQSLNVSPQTGVHVPNTVGFGGDYTHYNLTPLSSLSKNIHVFYDLYDVILTASKINFLKKYDRLGLTGPKGGEVDSKFITHNYETYKDGMYLGTELNMNHILFKIIGRSQKKYNTRHQYFYSNAKVVEIINSLI